MCISNNYLCLSYDQTISKIEMEEPGVYFCQNDSKNQNVHSQSGLPFFGDSSISNCLAPAVISV